MLSFQKFVAYLPGGKKPPLCKGRWHAKRDGGIVMQWKYNKDIVPTARMLRKNMTKEERHLWYDFLRTHPIRFSRQKVLGKYIADFYCAEAKPIPLVGRCLGAAVA